MCLPSKKKMVNDNGRILLVEQILAVSDEDADDLYVAICK